MKNSHLSRLGHTRHIRHAGHAPTEPQLTALHTDLSGTLAYLLMWPLFGTHYFYLRQPLLNVLYWFTGAGGGIWGLIDLFRMRSLVRTANEQSARQALQTLHVGAVFSSMPAAPRAMTQPVPPMYAPAAPPIPPMQPAHPTPQDR